MFDTLESWDKAATLAINSLHTPATDAFWMFVTGKWVWFPCYLVIAGLLIWKIGWKRGLIMILATILCITCVDQLCNLVKLWACRLRPCCDPEMIQRGIYILEPHHPNYPYGFFSAHAGNAMAFAMCMVFAFRYYPQEHPEKQKAYRTGNTLLIIWAVLVGLSRIFVAKHFLGDVLVGLAVGTLLAWALTSLGDLVIQKLKR